MQEYEVSMSVLNSREATITFILEPFGTSYPMEPHAIFTLTIRSPIQGVVEVEYGSDCITVYAWSGATDAVLSHNDETLYRY